MIYQKFNFYYLTSNIYDKWLITYCFPDCEA